MSRSLIFLNKLLLNTPSIFLWKRFQPLLVLMALLFMKSMQLSTTLSTSPRSPQSFTDRPLKRLQMSSSGFLMQILIYGTVWEASFSLLLTVFHTLKKALKLQPKTVSVLFLFLKTTLLKMNILQLTMSLLQIIILLQLLKEPSAPSGVKSLLQSILVFTSGSTVWSTKSPWMRFTPLLMHIVKHQLNTFPRTRRGLSY